MYVCLCKALTDRDVTRLVETGAGTFREVASRSGAGTVCGGCRPAIHALLEQKRHGSPGGAAVIPIRGAAGRERR